MNWIDYITKLDQTDKTKKFDFNSPLTDSCLRDLEFQFKLSELPYELEDLYKQTNGVNQILNGQKIGELIWTIDRVKETNHEYRNYPTFKDLYMSFDQLLFISDAGNGDLFGFVTLNGRFDRNDIFVWNHEDDSRIWVAPNLTKFVEWWINGSIKI